MKKKLTLISILLAGSIILSTPALNAQVTIGSGIAPNEGALLDLKEKSDGTSTKGLSLPRVKLTDVDNLYPMFTGSESDYTTQKTQHTGLWIYNVSGEAKPQCAAIPDGLYIWDGAKWQGIGINKSINLSLDVNKYELFFASGHDNRGATTAAQTVDIAWKPIDQALPWTKEDATFGGLQFTTNPLETSTSFTGGNKTFTVFPDVMPTPNPVSPWQSKETKFTFELINECGTIRRTVVANQTNYAIKVNNSFTHSIADSVYASVGFKDIPVEGNAKWNVIKVDPNETIKQFLSNSGGSDRSNGTTSSSKVRPLFQTGKTKYGSATIKVFDSQTPQRFDTIKVTTLSCIGTVDDSGTPGKDNTHKMAKIKTTPDVTYIDFPSGQDLRGNPTTQSFNLSWAPVDKNMPYTIQNTIGGGLPLTTALPASPLTTNNTTISMLPPVMTPLEVTNANPWVSKETKYTFSTSDDCNETDTKTITINQTNYALKVNNSLTDSKIHNEYVYTPINYKFKVRGNARWTTSKVDPENILSTATPIGSNNGVENKAGDSDSIDFQYTLSNITAYKISTADITFKDTAATKRFSDIKVSISAINCYPPEMDSLKARLGTLKDQPAANGVAWHEDHEGNIFFSAMFGTARWMNTNLATKTYGPRTSGSATLPHPTQNSVSSITVPYWENTWNQSIWSNGREHKGGGLVYNWAAATNRKNASTVDQAGSAHAKVQGICPKGWHLPSELEFANLLNEIKQNTSKYSRTPDIGGAPIVTLPGQNLPYLPMSYPMIGTCETYRAKRVFTSHSVLDGGFHAMLAEIAWEGTVHVPGENVYFWTSSSSGANPIPYHTGFGAYFYGLGGSNNTIYRDPYNKGLLVSVRCIKD